MSHFSDFGLAAPILKALASEGYDRPTPIQTQAIPHVLEGRDLLGIAQTGTGKTAAFALPILAPARRRRRAAPPAKACRALVLSPTRELASQIAESFRTYGRHLRASTAVVFGGVPIGKHERQLAHGVDILVATPGRLLDLIDRRALTLLSSVEILVLDEADQMLDLGFIHALKRIVTLLPAKRQTPVLLGHHAERDRRAGRRVSDRPGASRRRPGRRPRSSASSSASCSSRAARSGRCWRSCCATTPSSACSSSRAPSTAPTTSCAISTQAGIEAAAIHGNKSQPQRERALAAFRAGHCRVLVATDIAARGIDVDGVTHVVNFDLPDVPEIYVHRIGRTARAGADGHRHLALRRRGARYLRDIERLTRQKVPVEPLPKDLPVLKPAATPQADNRRPQLAADRPYARKHAAAPAKAHAGPNGASKGRRRGSGAPQQPASAGGLPRFIQSSVQQRRADTAARGRPQR